MAKIIKTEAGLFEFLLDRLSTPGQLGDYPVSFTEYADQLMAFFSTDLASCGAGILLGGGGPICPCCGLPGSARFAAILKDIDAGCDLRQYDRGLATLALDLIPRVPQSIRLRDANLVMVELLGMTGNGYISLIGGGIRTTSRGAKVLAARIELGPVRD